MHELVEPLRSDLLAESGDVEGQSLVLLSRLSVGCESIGQLRFRDIPEVGLLIFLELILTLQVVITECYPGSSQWI